MSQLRGYLEGIVCREVEAIDEGVSIDNLNQGKTLDYLWIILYDS